MRCYTKRETKITPEVYSMRQLATKYASKNKIHCYIREKNFVKYLKGEAPISGPQYFGPIYETWASKISQSEKV